MKFIKVTLVPSHWHDDATYGLINIAAICSILPGTQAHTDKVGCMIWTNEDSYAVAETIEEVMMKIERA